IYFGFKDIVTSFNITSRINNRKSLPVPIGFPIIPVTGNPAYSIYDRLPALDHSVKKGGFPYIGSPYNGYNIAHKTQSLLKCKNTAFKLNKILCIRVNLTTIKLLLLILIRL